MMRHGFQRLALLNSAGYSRAEVPLDAAVSLIAPNNTGKTSLINALQYLLIVDRRRMDFGAHDPETSRRFYFPHNSAYILLEVFLPVTGTVVLGCVGRGVSHDYEYFAYKGQLDLDDFRLASGVQVAQPQLKAHMAERGKLVFSYNSSEFAAAIYGTRRRGLEQEPDITLFRLDHPSHAEAYQRVLNRTLRLDRLRSSEVKDYLLTIFRRDLPDSEIDFKAEWDKAFAEVNMDRAQYDAALRQKPGIDLLEQQQTRRLALRGKLLYFRPRIDRLLVEWEDHFKARQSQLGGEIESIENRLENQHAELGRLSGRKHELAGISSELNKSEQRCAELGNEFALVTERGELEADLHATQLKLDEQTARVQNASSRSVAAIEREIASTRREREQLARARATLANNLYLHLQSQLEPDQLDTLNRVLNPQVLTLGESEFAVDPAALRSWLQTTTAPLQLPGLRIALDTLTAQYTQQSPAQIELQITELAASLLRLTGELEAAKNLDAARHEKARLKAQVDRYAARLGRYDEFLTLSAAGESRRETMRTLQAESDEILLQIERSGVVDRELRAAERQWQSALDSLSSDHAIIVQRRETRRDDAMPFTALGDLPNQPWLASTEPGLEQLRAVLDTYHHDCAELLRLDERLETLRAQLHAGGLTKFQLLGGSELEIQRIIDFAVHLPQEAQALERKARSAVVNVTACLRELRDGLLTFQSKMRDFNRLVSRRQLSDLSVFRIDPVQEEALVDAVGQLIRTAEQVESGETFALFDHGTVLDDASLNRAKELLIRVGEEKGCLRVEHLFRLEFVVGKAGRKEESFADIDSAASNGTVLMAKLVTGLALLHLMQDKRHKMQALCYLDEASALDPNNQRSLIETAEEFGFALIFASPIPLVTARYCVPISTVDGFNQIGRRSWQILEPIDQAAPA